MKITWPWQRKSFYLLALAALAISWTGLSFKANTDFLTLFFVTVSTVSLVMFVYGFDDLMDDQKFKLSVKSSRLFFLILIATASLASAFVYLAQQSFWSTVFILLSGLFYFRIKSILFLKNVLIGLCWGLLIFLGAGEVTESAVAISALFLTLQVVVGSIIRDFDDIAEDRKYKVSTLPIVLGFNKTILCLHVINILSLAVLYFGYQLRPALSTLWLLWIVVVIYRAVLIEVIRRQNSNSFILQQVNIGACGLIFFLRAVELWIL